MKTWIVVIDVNSTDVDIIQVDNAFLVDEFDGDCEDYLDSIGYNTSNISWVAYRVPPTIRIK